MTRGDGPERIAFFDVDETLVASKSMLQFWDAWVATAPPGAQEVAALGHAPREQRNRTFYRRFAGVPQHRLSQATAEWYREYRCGPHAFVSATVEALRAHQQAGDGVVLVSGSFPGLVEPVAEDLGADAFICTRQRVDDEGLLTGEVERPMIGIAKRDAVLELLEREHVPASACFAYGDHESDLPMLATVGHPVVIGDDPVLTEHARRLGWRRLAPTAGPFLP